MRKIFFATALLLSTAAFSQSTWRFGIKAGGNLSISNIKLNGQKLSADSRVGFFGGGLVELSPGDSDSHFKLQAEALFSDMNVNYPMQSVGVGKRSDKINLQQISVPILAKFYIIDALSINVGPTFNFNLNGKYTLIDQNNSELATKLNSDRLQTFQFGFAAGATYNLFKGFFVDARYNPTFGKINKNESGTNSFEYMNGKVKWSNAQIGIGYLF
ncbi:MAG TPA: porin family protein [Arachidicoccus sp.]